VKLWDVNGKLVRKLVAHTQGTNVRFSPNGRLLLTWGDSRDDEVSVKLWTLDGELLDSLSTERVNEAWFSPDGKWIFATSQSQKRAWSLDLDQLLQVGCDALHLYLANPAMIEDAKICSS
jgi:WD40 repeat protein